MGVYPLKEKYNTLDLNSNLFEEIYNNHNDIQLFLENKTK